MIKSIKFHRIKFYRMSDLPSVNNLKETIKYKNLVNFTQKFYRINLINLFRVEALIFKFYGNFNLVLRRENDKFIKFKNGQILSHFKIFSLFPRSFIINKRVTLLGINDIVSKNKV
jgi:hypothetical protein